MATDDQVAKAKTAALHGVTAWEGKTAADLNTTPISGGFSGAVLLKVICKDSTPECVLVKVRRDFALAHNPPSPCDPIMDPIWAMAPAIRRSYSYPLALLQMLQVSEGQQLKASVGEAAGKVFGAMPEATNFSGLQYESGTKGIQVTGLFLFKFS